MASSTQAVLSVLSTICEVLKDMKTKWREIGIGLGIPESKLLEFKEESDPLSAVLDYWLTGSAAELAKPILWSTLVDALRSSHVGEAELAEQISREYIQLDTQTEPAECCDVGEAELAEKISREYSQPDTQTEPAESCDINLQEVKEQLACDTCLCCCFQPTQLQCQHMICQDCLIGLVEQDQQGQYILTCSTCFEPTPFSAAEVANIQANQSLEIVGEDILELKQLVGEDGLAEAATSSVMVADPQSIVFQEVLFDSIMDSNIVVPEEVFMCCPDYKGKEMKLFCETCNETICWKCVGEGGNHADHFFGELDDVFENVVSSSLTTVGKVLEQIEARSYEIFSQKSVIEGEIQKKVTADDKKTELIGQLDQLTQAKQKSLEDQKGQIDLFRTHLDQCYNLNRDGTSHSEALGTAIKQVKEMISTFRSRKWEPSTEADMMFSFQEFQSWKVYDKGHPNPAGCFIKGQHEETKVGELCTTTLQAMDFNNQPCKLAPNSIECQLICQDDLEEIGVDIEGIGESKYTISYKLTNTGWHKLDVKVDGQHIAGSPFSVYARPSSGKLVAPVQVIGNVIGPAGVAISKSSGGVVVAERDKHCVTLFNPDGERLLSYGTHTSPCGVALDDEENILTIDNKNNCIQKFTFDGEFLTVVGTQCNTFHFDSISGLAVSPTNGRVYVSDEGNCRIHILDSDLTYCGAFGDFGMDRGQFDRPQHLACDSTGNVYVADRENHRIQVFTPEGEFLRMFGRRGEDKWSLKYPCGIAIDTDGRVYVSELGSHRVSMFSSEGHFVQSCSEKLNFPRGLAVDASKILYVCDSGNNCISQVLFPP